MTIEIARKVLLNMINNHIEKNNPELQLFTLDTLVRCCFDIGVLAYTVDDCFRIFLQSLTIYNRNNAVKKSSAINCDNVVYLADYRKMRG
jgi:hypothetical protein